MGDLGQLASAPAPRDSDYGFAGYAMAKRVRRKCGLFVSCKIPEPVYIYIYCGAFCAIPMG